QREVSTILSDYLSSFRPRVQKAGLVEMRRIIGIGNEYKQLLLVLMLVQPETSKPRAYICDKLGISNITDLLKVVLKRPYFAKADFQVERLDPITSYWNPIGISREFLRRLDRCIVRSSSRDEGYIEKQDIYINYYSVQMLINEFKDMTMLDLFIQFDNLKTIDMLKSISIDVTLASGKVMNTDHFSDGQFQTVYIYSIVELFKDRNCITLLDEPDSFLHPEWQFEFLDQVFNIADDAANNHVLMSSHSAATITSSKENLLCLFEINGTTVNITKVCRSDVIKALSGGHIILTEAEARLSINNILKSTTGPILFTEGITDEMILEVAWKKLFPETAITFVIQQAYDRHFLRNQFKRVELQHNYPKRMMFALFDFDEAYEDWKSLGTGNIVVSDPLLGMVKKLAYQYHYAMLLPVPNVEALKGQVLDVNDKPWGRGIDSHISMELMFYEESWGENARWFTKKSISCGGEIIEFQGDKVTFAKDVIPNLDPERFEIFRSMFEFIRDKCSLGS
ncbi:MAG: ATP-binding protein, partial [Candidatus Cloacimonetes bacterium]|nr:ATP-binding protein [Candidatus Cloacimonadota bacterium]